jgi:AbrB family looped-hinge helix DNA binding protein
MNIRVDAAGRIVLPKQVRERFRLSARTKLDLEQRAEELVLRRAEQSPSMERRDGMLVHLGKVPRGFRWDTIIIEESRVYKLPPCDSKKPGRRAR